MGIQEKSISIYFKELKEKIKKLYCEIKFLLKNDMKEKMNIYNKLKTILNKNINKNNLFHLYELFHYYYYLIVFKTTLVAK